MAWPTWLAPPLLLLPRSEQRLRLLLLQLLLPQRIKRLPLLLLFLLPSSSSRLWAASRGRSCPCCSPLAVCFEALQVAKRAQRAPQLRLSHRLVPGELLRRH